MDNRRAERKHQGISRGLYRETGNVIGVVEEASIDVHCPLLDHPAMPGYYCMTFVS